MDAGLELCRDAGAGGLNVRLFGWAHRRMFNRNSEQQPLVYFGRAHRRKHRPQLQLYEKHE